MEKEISGGGYRDVEDYKRHLNKYRTIQITVSDDNDAPINRKANSAAERADAPFKNAETLSDLLEIDKGGAFGAISEKTNMTFAADVKKHISDLFSNYICYNDAHTTDLNFYNKLVTPKAISDNDLYNTPSYLGQIIQAPGKFIYETLGYNSFNYEEGLGVSPSNSNLNLQELLSLPETGVYGKVKLNKCAQDIYESAIKYTNAEQDTFLSAIGYKGFYPDACTVNVDDNDIEEKKTACLNEYTKLINGLKPTKNEKSSFIKRLLAQARTDINYKMIKAETAFNDKLHILKIKKIKNPNNTIPEKVNDSSKEAIAKSITGGEEPPKDQTTPLTPKTQKEPPLTKTYYEYAMLIISLFSTDFKDTYPPITGLLIVCILLILFSIGYSFMMLFDVLSNISFKDGTAIPLNKNTFTYTVASSEDPRQSRYPFVYVLIANCLALQAVAFAWLYKYKHIADWQGQGGIAIPIVIIVSLLVLFNAGEFVLTNAVSSDYFLLHFLGGLLIILGIAWFLLTASEETGSPPIYGMIQVILIVVTIQVIVAFIGTYSYYKGSLVEIMAAANSVKTFNDYVYDHIYKNSFFLNDLIDNYDRHDPYKAIKVALNNLKAKGVQTAELTETQPILSYYGLLARISTVFGFKQDEAAAVAVDNAKVYFTINLFYALSQTNTVGAIDMFKPENIVLRSKVMPSDYLLNEAVYINDVSSMFLAANEGPLMTAEDIGNLLTYMAEVNNSANSFSTNDAIGPFLNMSVGVTIFQWLPIIMAGVGYSIQRRLRGIREEAAAAMVELEKRDEAARKKEAAVDSNEEATKTRADVYRVNGNNAVNNITKAPEGLSLGDIKLDIKGGSEGGKKRRRSRK